MNFTAENTSVTGDIFSEGSTISTPIFLPQTHVLKWHPQDLSVFTWINYVFLCNIIALFGFFSNIVNALVFRKHGFTEAITVSLFALALSDFFQLAMVLLVSNFHVPMLVFHSHFTFFLNRITYYVCGVLRICLSRIAIWITVLITLERCVCILYPFKIKVLFTPRKMTIAIAIIAFLILVSSIPVLATVQVVKSIHPATNATIYGIIDKELGTSMQDMSVVTMVCTQVSSLVIIVGGNAVLLLELRRRKQRWALTSTGFHIARHTVNLTVNNTTAVARPTSRSAAAVNPDSRGRISTLNIPVSGSAATAASPASNPSSTGRARGLAVPGPGTPGAVSLRDRRLSRMVVILSVILLISFIPSTVWFCLTRIEPKFKQSGR